MSGKPRNPRRTPGLAKIPAYVDQEGGNVRRDDG